MDQINLNKVFHTALIIAPPADLIGPIQDIRKTNDSAFVRWMPHVNLCFPFAATEQFDYAHQVLQDQLKDFPSFDVTLAKLNHFEHSKKCVLWLQPDTEDNNIVRLVEQIIKRFPQLDDQSKKSEDGFHPHLTLGQFNKAVINKQIQILQQKWQPIKFRCSELYMIAREGQDDPFRVVHIIKLKE